MLLIILPVYKRHTDISKVILSNVGLRKNSYIFTGKYTNKFLIKEKMTGNYRSPVVMFVWVFLCMHLY